MWAFRIYLYFMVELNILCSVFYNMLKKKFLKCSANLSTFFSAASWLFSAIVCLTSDVILTGYKLLYFLSCQVQAYTRLHAVRQSASSNSVSSTSGAWPNSWYSSSSFQNDHYCTQWKPWWSPDLPICLYTGIAFKDNMIVEVKLLIKRTSACRILLIFFFLIGSW